METSGGFSNDGSNTEFNFEEQTNTNLYVAFEHPIPLIPNVKVQRTAMDPRCRCVINSASYWQTNAGLTKHNANAQMDSNGRKADSPWCPSVNGGDEPAHSEAGT